MEDHVQLPLELLLQQFAQLGGPPQLSLRHYGGYAAEPALHAEAVQQMLGLAAAAEPALQAEAVQQRLGLAVAAEPALQPEALQQMMGLAAAAEVDVLPSSAAGQN